MYWSECRFLIRKFKKNSFFEKNLFFSCCVSFKICRRKVTWVFLVVITYSLIPTFHLLKQVSYKLFQASGCLCFTSQTRVFHHSRVRLLKTIDVIVHVNSHESFWLLKNFLKQNIFHLSICRRFHDIHLDFLRIMRSARILRIQTDFRSYLKQFYNRGLKNHRHPLPLDL